MAQSGVELKEDVVPTYMELKLGHKFQYIILGITDDKKHIEVKKKGEKGATFDELADLLRKDAANGFGRYAVYDCAFEVEGNRRIEKILCICFASDDLPIKDKMIISSSSDALTKKLDGASKWQVNDPDDLTEEEMMKKCKSLGF